MSLLDILLLALSAAVGGGAAVCAFLEVVLWFGLNPWTVPPRRCVGFFLQCVGVALVAFGAFSATVHHVVENIILG